MNDAEDLIRRQHQDRLDQAAAWRLQRRAQVVARAERRLSRAEHQLARRRCEAEQLTAKYGPQAMLAD